MWPDDSFSRSGFGFIWCFSPLPSPWTTGTEACVSKSANSALSVTMNNKNEKINEKSPLLCAFQLNWGQRDSVFTDV